ncbi:hypothetical protein [Amycolatopsis acidicola]|nr:hypothetical protein [Amycolatopsis acidicola]
MAINLWTADPDVHNTIAEHLFDARTDTPSSRIFPRKPSAAFDQ